MRALSTTTSVRKNFQATDDDCIKYLLKENTMSVAAQPLTTEDSALSPWWLCMVLLEASDHL